MAIEVEYWKIPGRDEEIPVFRNLSRSVVKRGADKIYWRLKDVREKRFGSWGDGVWLDCETGDIRFGERCVQESWRDYFDGGYRLARYEDPFSRDFEFFYRRTRENSRVYSWYLGGLSEWRGADAELEPRLAARLAEAAEFNFGLDFTGPEEENPFLAAANEVARFYETRARLERLAEEADARGEKYWDGEFPKTSAEELEELRRRTDRFDLEDCDPRIFQVPVCWRVEKASGGRGSKTTAQNLVFDAINSALVPYCQTRSREIRRRCKAALRKIPASEIRARQKAEEYFQRLEDDLNYGFNFDYRADESPRLGEVDELIAEARSGTSSEGEEPSGEFAPATHSDALSDDWRERLPSLLDYRLDRCNALFQAAKTLYLEILATKIRSMKGVDVWGARSGCDLETYVAGDRPKNPTWLKIGALTEFYEAKRGVYWGTGVKKEDKIGRKDDARQWLAREIGRRLEAALKAER
ncbi:MAG: hypothetical protein IIW01_05975 [Thermoguttaceae bacterium]|nr:hypothetical protein [Thermoguttaceae bacterium]